MSDLTDTERIARLEAQVELLTRAFHGLASSAKPASDWLEANMEKIQGSADG